MPCAKASSWARCAGRIAPCDPRSKTRHQLVGESAALRQILDQVRRAAPTNATVLILGESGVGKELVARSIHRSSLRARERFVQVNCAAIPEELIESELFGHERGAFTGATEKQVGKFEMADRGTIFLDEVGDMSPKTQAKVLRVLQEGEVERLGSSRTIKVDVRVIAATNKDLEEEIAAGRFREDLYFRLSVIPILVPPLARAARGHPAARAALRGAVQPREQPAARPVLAGRARGAGRGALARQHPRAAQRRRAPAHHERPRRHRGRRRAAGGATRRRARPAPAAASGSRPSSRRRRRERPVTLREFKEWSERAFLVDKLREFGWNISKTADVIDTPRSNLYKKLEQYNIKQEGDSEAGSPVPRPGSQPARIVPFRRSGPDRPPAFASALRASSYGGASPQVRSLPRRSRSPKGGVRRWEESPNSRGQCAG